MTLAPSPEQLWTAWERGLGKPAAQQALVLLAASAPDGSHGDLPKLSVGQRDRRLLELRRSLFGSQVTGVTDCPNCGHSMELDFRIEDILVDSPDSPEQEFVLESEGYVLRFRLPNSLDLTVVSACHDVSLAKHRLLERCLLEIHGGGQLCSMDALPQSALAAVATHMAQADPQADVQLALECANCGHRWQVPFDIVRFLWAELNVWSERLLHDVHGLASAYGWSESQILALPAWRRQRYLELIGS